MVKKILTFFVLLVSFFIFSTPNIVEARPTVDPGYSVNCDEVERYVFENYPLLKEGETIRKNKLLKMLDNENVNYKKGKRGKMYKIGYEEINVSEASGVWLRPKQKDAYKCTLIFSRPNKKKVTYWGVDVIRTDDNEKPYVSLGPIDNMFGAILLVVENNLSVTPYKAVYK